MDGDSPVIVWFRRDLRLADNPALSAAAESARPVIPVYVLDTSPGARALGGASRWWLDKSLRALAADLQRQGLRLILRRGDPEEIIPALAETTGAGSVTWNRLPEMPADAGLQARLARRGVAVFTFNAAYLIEPGTLTTGSGQGYQVFTAFWRAARARIGNPAPLAAPSRMVAPASWPDSDDLAAWELHPRHPDWSAGFAVWSPGEAGAQAQLDEFLAGALGRYATDRDRPDIAGSSRLSPHLRWGEVGPRQIWGAVSHALGRHPGAEAQAEKFLAELGWREFNGQLLRTYPELARMNIRSGFDSLPWREDPVALAAWQRGSTGYPIVDAGMRELWHTGWMHNRVRLITASFLVKDLLIDWRLGEAWFWDTLVDADPANNPANWQWAAGTGADAAPFFRIFNPILQGRKFDPDGAYIRRWIPELAPLGNDAIHAPWTAPPDVLAALSQRTGRAYPAPIVDHAVARRRALEALQAARAAA